MLPFRKNIKFSSASVKSDYKLYAANGTVIDTYGLKTLILDFKLRRPFRWSFILANVSQPILGADFLTHYKLLVDLSNRKLIDGLTNLRTIGSISSIVLPSINTYENSHVYHDILSQFPELTKPLSFKHTPNHPVVHHVETSGHPVHAKARPLPPARYKKVREEFRTMTELGICRPSKSPWASALHVVPKSNGELRPCGDYRRLNAITKPDRYPIPRLNDFTFILSGKRIFSKIDINRAFHCIPVAPEDIEKTAIITPFGLFEFPRMSFGLRNAAQTFQRFMNNTVLNDINVKNENGKSEIGTDFLFCYLDDILIASDSEISHKRHLTALFERLEKFGVTINLNKCRFGQTKLEFLGHEVTPEGIKPAKTKVEAITNFPRPETVDQLRRFLGMVNFYRPHLPNAVEFQSLLNNYLVGAKRKDKTKINWTDDSNKAFIQCKNALKSAATLSYPTPDAPLALMTDASNNCIGAVLQQRSNNCWKPLGYFSRKLTPAQGKYSTYDRELLAIYEATIHFRKLFEGRELIIYTDHKPLPFAFTKLSGNKETPRRTRQLMYISEFCTDIRHIAGSDNIVADTLSRVETITCPTTIDFAELATAQETDASLKQLISNQTMNIELKQIFVPECKQYVYCETSTSMIKPYLPEQFRRIAFNSVHNLSHPGINTSRKLISKRFFWPGINKDIGLWAKTCVNCQKSKVQRHTVSNLGQFSSSDRFEHIHVDIVGPLPTSSEGFRYLVTVIDRRTHWPEAFPTRDITADTVAKIIYEGWITRFGCPIRLTSDQGRQFESALFQELMKCMGIHKIRTTPYHPQSNGAVERWHRSLKASLCARLQDNSSWIEELPTVLLGLRSTLRSDSGHSPADLTYGCHLRLPGDFYDNKSTDSSSSHTLVDNIRDTIRKIKPVSHNQRDSRSMFIHPDLKNCESVFIRNDAVRRPLQPPYDGPFRVMSRGDKVYKIQLPTRQTNISIDRLKPAYLINEDTSFSNIQNCTSKPTEKILVSKSAEGSHSSALQKTTRSGRKINTPVRFQI